MLKVKTIYDSDDKNTLENKINKFLKLIPQANIRTITFHQGTSAYNAQDYYPVCFITYEETP